VSAYIPQQFVEKWERAELKECASTQEHFMDLCHLVGHPTPAQMDPEGTSFTSEAGGKTTTGGQGYADVSCKGHFAIEYKGKGKYATLDAAYQQLLKYREYLGNPPLLIVWASPKRVPWLIRLKPTGCTPRNALLNHPFLTCHLIDSGSVSFGHWMTSSSLLCYSLSCVDAISATAMLPR
jgi:hypothetical protein